MALALKADQVRRPHRRNEQELNDRCLLHAEGVVVAELLAGRNMLDQTVRQIDQPSLRDLEIEAAQERLVLWGQV
jgi:hypothetical protein